MLRQLPDRPGSFTLALKVFPNPSTVIAFKVHSSLRVKLAVFYTFGKTLSTGFLAEGGTAELWGRF